MVNKAPSPGSSKKQGKSLMEKRAVKKAKKAAQTRKGSAS
jgi:hypothetical protein